MNKEEFIKKADGVHEGKYDYTPVVYVNSRTNLLINCPIHGQFSQLPSNHLRGRGCRKCAIDKRITPLDNFITTSDKVHNQLYDYSKVVSIKNLHTPVVIVCKIHGEFTQTPDNHLKGKGCKICSIEKQALTTTEFVDRAITKHGDTYEYESVEYEHSKTPVMLSCKKHGKFLQLPNAHLQGRGCPKCITRQSTGELEILEYVKRLLSN